MTTIILYLPLSAGQYERDKVEYNIYEKAVSESALGIFTFHIVRVLKRLLLLR